MEINTKGLEALTRAGRDPEGESPADHVALPSEAAKKIGNALDRSRADQWPDAVYALQA